MSCPTYRHFDNRDKKSFHINVPSPPGKMTLTETRIKNFELSKKKKMSLLCDLKHVSHLKKWSKHHINTKTNVILIASLLCKLPIKNFTQDGSINMSNLTFVSYSLLCPIPILWKDFDLYIVRTLLVPPLSKVPTPPFLWKF